MNFGGYFEPEKKSIRINELEKMTLDSNFWNDKKKSEEVINELNSLKKQIDSFSQLKDKIKSNIELLQLINENPDSEIKEIVENDINTLKNELEEKEIITLLNDKYDKMSAILELHSGAGGTEAQDWAYMLYRMYERWCQKKGYKFKVVDIYNCEDAGIKSASIIIEGEFAYGNLKSEKGVHRLVRISPFDSGARRHTSFASVDVMPLFDNEKSEIEINPTDIRIDVYRSSGCGGQGVNTTDSAVRITHIPTKIVVTCQNERSQIQNKETALTILKNKLYNLEVEKKENELKKIRGEVSSVEFGSQIRSYVMHPYSLVKDHRTNAETSNVSKVLNGDIDIFINAYLKRGSNV